MKRVLISGLVTFLLFISVLFFYFYEYNSKTVSSSYCIATEKTLSALKKGDLILRKGTALDSSIIMRLSKSSYSHIGIVTSASPQIIITHAASDDETDHKNMVISSRADSFLSNELALKFAVIRYSFLTENETDAVIKEVLGQIGKPFVLGKRGDDMNLRYCTTLIYDAIRKVHSSFELNYTYVDLPLFEGEYLFPQAFIDYDKKSVIIEE